MNKGRKPFNPKKKKKTKIPFDVELAKKMKNLAQQNAKEKAMGIKITNQKAKNKYSIKEHYPKTLNSIRLIEKRNVIARINYNGIELLVEPTPYRNGPKIFVQTPEGKHVEITRKTEKKIIDQVSKIYYDTTREGGVETATV